MNSNEQQQEAGDSLGQPYAAGEAAYPTDENVLEQCHQIFSDISEAKMVFLKESETSDRTNTATPIFQLPEPLIEQAGALIDSLTNDRQVSILIDLLCGPVGVSEFISTTQMIFEGADLLLSKQILAICHVYMQDCWMVSDPHTRPGNLFNVAEYHSLWSEALSEKCRIRELKIQEDLSTHSPQACDD